MSERQQWVASPTPNRSYSLNVDSKNDKSVLFVVQSRINLRLQADKDDLLHKKISE